MQHRDQPALILASGSAARCDMLNAAGVEFSVEPAALDEAQIRLDLMTTNTAITPRDIALHLACTKAESVSRRHPEAIVIGSDQVLDFQAQTISKPKSVSEAREILLRLRGHRHDLHSAVALARGGETIWNHVDTTRLTMRAFSDAFLASYLEKTGASVCKPVGAYKIESQGVQLFERIEGDHFTILGMPLLPLLAELRFLKVLTA